MNEILRQHKIIVMKCFLVLTFNMTASWKSGMTDDATQLLNDFEKLLSNKDQKKFFENVSKEYFNVPHKTFASFGKKVATILEKLEKQKNKNSLKPLQNFSVSAVPEVVEFLEKAPKNRKWMPEEMFGFGPNFPEGHEKYNKMRYNPFAGLVSNGLKTALERIFFNDPDMINLIKNMPSEINKVTLAEWLANLNLDELNKAKELFDTTALEDKNITFKLKNIQKFQVRGLNTELISKNILNEANKNIPLLQEYQVAESDIPLTFWLPYEKKSSRDYILDKSTIENITIRSLLVMELQSLFSAEPIKKLAIMFVPTHELKIFPEQGSFTPASINSAYYEPAYEILAVFRKEELLKTLIHELYHRIEIDKNLGSKATENWAQEHFAIKYSGNHRFLLSEAVVEAMACITNIVVCAFYDSAKGKSKKTFKNTMRDMLITEQLFSAYQSAKILAITGFDSLETFLNPSSTEFRIEESTAAAEYHIIKASLLNRVDQFLAIFMDKENIDNRAQEIEKLLIESFADSMFNELINTFIKMVNNKEDESYKTLHSTGRMTIVEMKASR